jgi:hypothetical protein
MSLLKIMGVIMKFKLCNTSLIYALTVIALTVIALSLSLYIYIYTHTLQVFAMSDNIII